MTPRGKRTVPLVVSFFGEAPNSFHFSFPAYRTSKEDSELWKRTGHPLIIDQPSGFMKSRVPMKQLGL